MKILITGGAGFIASHIVDAYLADGHDVIVFDNLTSGLRENVNQKARFFEIDVTTPEAAAILREERPEVLNHHAAQIDVRLSIEEPMTDVRTNVLGLVNLLEAGRSAGLKKVIIASSGGAIYGEQEVFPATEEHSTWPVNPYGIDKLACEKFLFYYTTQYGIPSIAFRYANVYGPRQALRGEAGVVAIFIKRMLSGGTPTINGDGTQTRDYVYVDDVVAANRLALSLKDQIPPPCAFRLAPFACFNVGTGVETDVSTIFRALCECTGSACKEVHGPAIPDEQRRSSLSSAKIERAWGWRPAVTLSEGLKRTAEWFSTRLS